MLPTVLRVSESLTVMKKKVAVILFPSPADTNHPEICVTKPTLSGKKSVVDSFILLANSLLTLPMSRAVDLCTN